MPKRASTLPAFAAHLEDGRTLATAGILTSSSTQLFDADTQVEKEEFDGADKALRTICGRPVTTDPTLSCQQLLGAIAKHSKSIVNTPNAGLLYQKLVDLNPAEEEIQDIVELRRVKSHLTLILDELHSASLAVLSIWLAIAGPMPAQTSAEGTRGCSS